MQAKAVLEIGPYQLFERIGEGGNGTVYRAIGPSGPVAIKLVGDVDDASRARFGREVATLGTLSHPSLIALLDHGIDAELGAYLVTPLLPGRDLRASCTGRMCPEAALLVIEPIIAAVAALHAAGYVHRDLKPENAIAQPDGAITVIDLGLAWRDDMTRHTDTGAAVGSVGYMSPEQIDGRPVDTAADIWALGVMIYEWIAGKRPFSRPRPSEEAAAVLIGAFSPLSAVDRRCGDDLSRLVGDMLASDPAKRPPIADVARRIDDIIDWTDDRAVDRAAVVADASGYQARIAPFRTRRLERTARDAIAAGKPFVALTACDRGLAYVPDHPALIELVAAAESATAHRDPPSLPDRIVSEQTPVSTVISHSAHTRPPWSRRKRWLVGGAIAAGVIGAIVLAAAWPGSSSPSSSASRLSAGSSDPSSDPFAVLATPRTTTRVETHLDDKDRELVHDVVGVFGKFIDVAAKDNGEHRVGPDGNPITANGWLRKANAQKGAAAVASVRKALELEPGNVDARFALCLELASVDDPEAVAACDTSLLHRDDVMAHAARGKALIKAGNPKAALADLDLVVSRDRDVRWKRLRASARKAAGDAVGAKRDLDDACKGGDAKACALTPSP